MQRLERSNSSTNTHCQWKLYFRGRCKNMAVEQKAGGRRWRVELVGDVCSRNSDQPQEQQHPGCSRYDRRGTRSNLFCWKRKYD